MVPVAPLPVVYLRTLLAAADTQPFGPKEWSQPPFTSRFNLARMLAEELVESNSVMTPAAEAETGLVDDPYRWHAGAQEHRGQRFKRVPVPGVKNQDNGLVRQPYAGDESMAHIGQPERMIPVIVERVHPPGDAAPHDLSLLRIGRHFRQPED